MSNTMLSRLLANPRPIGVEQRDTPHLGEELANCIAVKLQDYFPYAPCHLWVFKVDKIGFATGGNFTLA